MTSPFDRLPLRAAQPPYASSLFVQRAREGASWTRPVWMEMLAAAARDSDQARWAATVLEARDPMALFWGVAHSPTFLDHVLAAADGRRLRARLESCPLWLDVVGLLRPPTSAHARLSVLGRMPSGQALDRFVDVAYPLLVGPASWIHTADRIDSWHGFETAWRTQLGLPTLPTEKRARQAAYQARRGRTKGPIGGDDARRPPRKDTP